MKKLLRFEWYNLLHQRLVFGVMGAMLVLLAMINHTSPSRLEYFQTIGYGAEDMLVGATRSCFFTSFLAVAVALLVCRDYEQKITKNVVARGYSDALVYSAKFLFAQLVTTVAFLLAIGLSYGQAMVVFGPQPTHVAAILFAQYVAALAYTAFDVLLCRLLVKGGWAMALSVLLPPIGGLLLDVVDQALPLPVSIGDVWISQTMAYISGGTITPSEILLSLLTSAVYILGCYWLGRRFGRESA